MNPLDNWSIEPQPLKRECAGCGRHEHVNAHDLCDTCEEDFNADMAMIEEQERQADDRDARSRYYGA